MAGHGLQLYVPNMKRVLPIAFLVAACSGSDLNTTRGSNGETIVGNDVSVQITGAANPTAAFSLAETYCRKNDRTARFVSQNGATAAFDCVRPT